MFLFVLDDYKDGQLFWVGKIWPLIDNITERFFAMDRQSKTRINPVARSVIMALCACVSVVEGAPGSYPSDPGQTQSQISRSLEVQSIDGLAIVKADRFSIDYEFDDQTMRYVSRIELWCGQGKTGPWQLYDYDLDRKPPVDFSVSSEGVWRFLVVPVDVNGVRYYQNSSGNTVQTTNSIAASVPAQTTVFVDYTKPQIFMHEPVLQTGINGKKQVVVQWNVFDSYLDNFPAQLFWIESGKQQWQPIGTALKAFDSYTFTIPDNVSKPIYFKLVCEDKAANVQESVSGAISLMSGGESGHDVSVSNSNVYALESAIEYQGLPEYPAGSPLISTDINDSYRTGPNAIPQEKFLPGGVGVSPSGSGSSQPVQRDDTPLEREVEPVQRQYTVEPALNYVVAKDNSAGNNAVQSVSISKRASEYLLMGQDAYQRGEYERSRMIYEQVIAMEPGYYDAYYLLADVLYLQGKIEQARSNFDIFLSHNPNHRKALLGLMYCHLKLNNLNQAKELLNKVNYLNAEDERWNSLVE